MTSDLENNVTTSKAQTSPKPSGAAKNLSQTKPIWRQQWRRVPPPTILQNQGETVISPVLPTMAPMQPNATKPQTASKSAPKTASKPVLPTTNHQTATKAVKGAF